MTFQLRTAANGFFLVLHSYLCAETKENDRREAEQGGWRMPLRQGALHGCAKGHAQMGQEREPDACMTVSSEPLC